MADVAWMLLCVLWQIGFVSGSQSFSLCLSHSLLFPVIFLTSSKWEKCLQIKKSKFGQIADPPLCFLQTYVDYMTRLYEREIKDFFEVAKIKMAGTSKDGKGKFGKTSIKTFFFKFVY